MFRKFSYLALLVICLAIFACATTSGTPLQQAAGNWGFSFEETLKVSQDMRDMIAEDPDMEQYMRESMQGLVLTIDAKRNVMILTMDGEVDDETEFTVVSESPAEGKLVLDMDGNKFILHIKGDRMEWVESGDTLVFQRMNK